jgi:hypothetical protein
VHAKVVIIKRQQHVALFFQGHQKADVAAIVRVVRNEASETADSPEKTILFV